MDKLSIQDYLMLLTSSEQQLFHNLVAQTQSAIIMSGIEKATESVSSRAIEQARATMDLIGYGYFRYLKRLSDKMSSGIQYKSLVQSYRTKLSKEDYEILMEY